MTDYNMKGKTYRYSYEDHLYPFGYGWSYSKFTYRNLNLSQTTIKQGENITISVMVENIGLYDADEVRH